MDLRSYIFESTAGRVFPALPADHTLPTLTATKSDIMILAHWTYSPDEWLAFRVRKQSGKRFWQALSRRMGISQQIPEVIFTTTSVRIGDRELELRSPAPGIREVNLYEEGDVNVMRLVFVATEVPILIPRGKLREALAVREVIQKVQGLKGSGVQCSNVQSSEVQD